MICVSDELQALIRELQSIPGLANFALAGGTNLALRYNHRISVDIDLTITHIIGIEAFRQIIRDIIMRFGEAQVKCQLINEELGDQYVFVRVFITQGDLTIKVELLQNMICILPVEIHNNIRLVSKLDIGLFKMMSASNRFAKKDIYDLVFITEEISIIELYEKLKEKSNTYCEDSYKTIFDLDGEISPVSNPELLLEFDEQKTEGRERPFHSHDRIDIVNDSKSWIVARMEWRNKVRELFKYLNKEFPKPKGIDVN